MKHVNCIWLGIELTIKLECKLYEIKHIIILSIKRNHVNISITWRIENRSTGGVSQFRSICTIPEIVVFAAITIKLVTGTFFGTFLHGLREGSPIRLNTGIAVRIPFCPITCKLFPTKLPRWFEFLKAWYTVLGTIMNWNCAL